MVLVKIVVHVFATNYYYIIELLGTNCTYRRRKIGAQVRVLQPPQLSPTASRAPPPSQLFRHY